MIREITVNNPKFIYNQAEIKNIQNYIYQHPNDSIIFKYKNTIGLTPEILNKMKNYFGENRIKIQIVGGYTQDRVNNYPHLRNMHTEDNVYYLKEMEDIIKELEIIEEGVNYSWDETQRLFYLIGQLKNKIIYHPRHEIQPSKDIRSLRGLTSRKTVCAGYALILKELCDRWNIDCQYVEGSCNQDDHNHGYLTHAWNIVKLNGNYIPVDLTWNAGKNARGISLNMSDIANVNEFIKTHFPGRYEKIQDYKILKSIEGQKVRTLNNLMTKDINFDLSNIYGTRQDGTKYKLTQVGQFTVDGEYVYKYIVYDINQKTNKLGPPIILYSKTNVLRNISLCNELKKLKDKYIQLKRQNRNSEANEIFKRIIALGYVDIVDNEISELLFSVNNIKAAIQRKDYYVGEIQLKNDNNNRIYVHSVHTNPAFGKKIGLIQKTIRRSNGTELVIESDEDIKIHNYGTLKRYKVYEEVYNENGRKVTKVNTIFTDKDIMHDNRKEIGDIFLSRSRLDRKRKETNGYLGYLDQFGTKIYDPRINEVMKTGLYQATRLKQYEVRNYFNELTFNDMKKLVQVYETRFDNNKIIIVNRRTQQPIKDKELELKAKFALNWLSAASSKYYVDDPVPGFKYAFNSSSEKTFNLINHLITESMNKDGNIDPVAILDKIDQNISYKYANDIVIKLFNKYNIKEINELYRLQNPSSLPPKKDIEYLQEYRINKDEAYRKLVERRKKIFEETKQTLVITKNAVGNVELKPIKK